MSLNADLAELENFKQVTIEQEEQTHNENAEAFKTLQWKEQIIKQKEVDIEEREASLNEQEIAINEKSENLWASKSALLNYIEEIKENTSHDQFYKTESTMQKAEHLRNIAN